MTLAESPHLIGNPFDITQFVDVLLVGRTGGEPYRPANGENGNQQE
jgi:hypothetical protein